VTFVHSGRRRLCLTFCITYTLACGIITFRSLPVLLVGRIVETSAAILFSAFESWVISAASTSVLTTNDLSTILGSATLVNGFVATAAGVASNHLVSSTGTLISPFVAGAAVLLLTSIVIKTTCDENYGSAGSTSDLFQLCKLGEACTIVRNGTYHCHRFVPVVSPAPTDLRLLVLGFTQTCFEGSMYLFVFLWVQALQETAPPSSTLPLGLIFSSFMISMMLGSVLYTSIASCTSFSLLVDARISTFVCSSGAVALATSVAYKEECQRFWAFCLLEACVGMYYPV
jgi:MFS transporter, MFS domain-containing protein family, molybdate-anion transporter